jgi:hypothetical protein
LRGITNGTDLGRERLTDFATIGVDMHQHLFMPARVPTHRCQVLEGCPEPDDEISSRHQVFVRSVLSVTARLPQGEVRALVDDASSAKGSCHCDAGTGGKFAYQAKVLVRDCACAKNEGGPRSVFNEITNCFERVRVEKWDLSRLGRHSWRVHGVPETTSATSDIAYRGDQNVKRKIEMDRAGASG